MECRNTSLYVACVYALLYVGKMDPINCNKLSPLVMSICNKCTFHTYQHACMCVCSHEHQLLQCVAGISYALRA